MKVAIVFACAVCVALAIPTTPPPPRSTSPLAAINSTTAVTEISANRSPETTTTSEPATTTSEPATTTSELPTTTDQAETATDLDDLVMEPGPKPETGTKTTPNYNNTKRPPPFKIPSNDHCSDLLGYFWNGEFIGLEVKHDLYKILEQHGGPPGKVNATWTEKEDAPVGNNTDERPLPDADQKYWLYKYGDTDGDKYIRIEHAVRRFSGTPKAFLEIRGKVYWTPEDFCGKARWADYIVDDRGFTFEVSRQYCWISPTTYTCANPNGCVSLDDNTIRCLAGPATGLLAALVGGGK